VTKITIRTTWVIDSPFATNSTPAHTLTHTLTLMLTLTL
jgi:hypothetical protein